MYRTPIKTRPKKNGANARLQSPSRLGRALMKVNIQHIDITSKEQIHEREKRRVRHTRVSLDSITNSESIGIAAPALGPPSMWYNSGERSPPERLTRR